MLEASTGTPVWKYNFHMETREANSTQTEATACQETYPHLLRIQQALDSMPPHREIVGATELLKAVGDPTRMRLLLALSTGELCVCDLQSILDMSQSAVSHQLRVLREARLVKHRRQGKMAYYSLHDEHVEELLIFTFAHVRHD